MDKNGTEMEHVKTSPVETLPVDTSPVETSPAEKALVRKIDLLLLPTVWLMYLLSYMDRTNIGNAKISRMDTDLDLDSTRYSISLIVFFVPYVLCEVPSNMILVRTRPSIFLGVIMFLWGCVTILMGFIQTYPQLVGLRIVVGVLEAGFSPGVLLVLSSWYKKDEQSRRFAAFISAAILSGAFGGLLAGSITRNLDGARGIAGWRWLFILEGAATMAWSLVAMNVLPDFPANERRISGKQRELAIARLESDHARADTRNSPMLGHWEALKMACKEWRTFLFVVGYMAIVGSSTLSYFYPTLVQGLGYRDSAAQYMTIPIYGAAFVATLITGVVADFWPSLRGVFLAGWMSVAVLCAVVICAVYRLGVRYALLVIMGSALWASNALSLSYSSSTFGALPPEVKAISLALVNAMGNMAQIYGAYLFPDRDKPKYLLGFGVLSGMCFTGVLAYAALHVSLRRFPPR